MQQKRGKSGARYCTAQYSIVARDDHRQTQAGGRVAQRGGRSTTGGIGKSGDGVVAGGEGGSSKRIGSKKKALIGQLVRPRQRWRSQKCGRRGSEQRYRGERERVDSPPLRLAEKQLG